MSAAMTVGSNGTEGGTLETRIGGLIRERATNIGILDASCAGLTGTSIANFSWMCGARKAPAARAWISGHAFQKCFFRRAHGVGGADMHPDPVETQAEQAFPLVGGIEHLVQ